jgi:hypothetical protein
MTGHEMLDKLEGQHTPGKLVYLGPQSLVAVDGTRRLSIAMVLPQAVDIDTNRRYCVNFETNAKRLALCWNSHDDLLEACEADDKWLRENTNASDRPASLDKLRLDAIAKAKKGE